MPFNPRDVTVNLVEIKKSAFNNPSHVRNVSCLLFDQCSQLVLLVPVGFDVFVFVSRCVCKDV